jgi:hypothetical protein
MRGRRNGRRDCGQLAERRHEMRISSLLRIVPAIACAGLSAIVLGTAAPSSLAASCSFPPSGQPFTPWSDANHYFSAPGGNFETGAPSWGLTGSASVQPGNEPYDVTGSGTSSLSLPTTTAAATTPTMCVTSDAPEFRVFIKNNGNLGYTNGQLAVYLNFQNSNGKWQQVKIAALTVKNTNWTLSPKISFIQYISTPLQSGYANVSFTFKPNDNHGNWQLDDFYVDPIKHT